MGKLTLSTSVAADDQTLAAIRVPVGIIPYKYASPVNEEEYKLTTGSPDVLQRWTGAERRVLTAFATNCRENDTRHRSGSRAARC